MTRSHSVQTLPDPSLTVRAGVGLKAEHYQAVLDSQPDIGWFEVHPENYMGQGGPSHRYLSAIRENYPLSLHGVGLSIGGGEPIDTDHVARLKNLADRYEPALISEHLAWSTHAGAFFNDLLPLPYVPETLHRVAEHVDQLQTALGRQVMIENPATYVVFAQSTIEETDFLDELARHTGCGLLLDVNNVFVSCTNHRTDPADYLARFPMHRVGEIHLAGHDTKQDPDGGAVLIDTHDRIVADPVWQLFSDVIESHGPRPTLIEWDGNIPTWPVLFDEAAKAQAVLNAQVHRSLEPQHA